MSLIPAVRSRGQTTNKDKILSFLYDNAGKPFCDDHLSEVLNIKPRQQVYQICTKLYKEGLIMRDYRICVLCKKQRVNPMPKKCSWVVIGSGSEWLRFAAMHLRRARAALKVKDLGASVFWVHQAIELALKAIWASKTGSTPPKTHILTELYIGVKDSVSLQDESALSELTRYYYTIRYPLRGRGFDISHLTHEEVKKLLAIAESVLKDALNIIGR